MVIVTTAKQRGPSLPSKRPFASVYEIGKKALRYYGYYDKYNLQQYDPDWYYKEYVGKYTYKPRKRLAGYAGQGRTVADCICHSTRSIARLSCQFHTQKQKVFLKGD